MDDLERLKELAEKATPGPWFVGIADEPRRGPVDAEYKAPGYYDNIGVISSTSGGTAVGCNEYNVFSDLGTATYIAAANPEVVLKIIARVRELEANQRTPGTVEVCKQCHRPLPDAMVISMRKGCSGDCPIRSVSPSP